MYFDPNIEQLKPLHHGLGLISSTLKRSFPNDPAIFGMTASFSIRMGKGRNP
jgi:hypothetical protein